MKNEADACHQQGYPRVKPDRCVDIGPDGIFAKFLEGAAQDEADLRGILDVELMTDGENVNSA